MCLGISIRSCGSLANGSSCGSYASSAAFQSRSFGQFSEGNLIVDISAALYYKGDIFPTEARCDGMLRDMPSVGGQ
jgi:hypothetical protein